MKNSLLHYVIASNVVYLSCSYTAHVRGALQATRRVEAVFLIPALHPIYMRQANAATKSPRAMKVYGRGSEISRCARFLVSVAEQI